MYRKIMVPVDLGHVERLDKALATAAELSRQYDIPLCYVGVAAATPGSLAPRPEEFAARLDAFAREEAARRNVADASSAACISHDPTTDLDATLLQAIRDTGADLVVMASHVPGLAEHLFASNAGYVAMHAEVTVMVVR